ncbi:hypothetical protein LEL_08900 [Akanthomyces lecanii RCEF 1005]|uniref:NAD dependent epimerase/dehydratase n=1 Tax=Akanthomyces lecanii RCEF 1005 TaxID=1081108 RepID=A0A168CQC5_CORDF|nr:hypothetical protein LEL_08900 [Akanthomyces lecanii RCEF 1005]
MRFFSNTVTVDPADRTSLRVLAAGLPRCATSSMQTAFDSKHLGLAPCMHFAHIAPNPQRGDIVLAALREENTERRHKLLYTLFNGFLAASDMPPCVFADDLMDMYPDAKIVLNKRPGGGHKWVPSMQLLTFAASPVYRALCFLWKTDRNVAAMWDEIEVVNKKKLGLKSDELWTAKHYDAHNAWVHAEAAKRGRDVLEFEPQDGWEPLCTLLGQPTPKDEPFPHRNDASEVRMIVRILYLRGAISWLALAAAVYGVTKWLVNGRIF